MDDADVIEERFWAIARDIGPLRPAPLVGARGRATLGSTALFLIAGPVVAAAVAWSVIAVALGL